MARVNPMEKYTYLIGTKINKWEVLGLSHERRGADAICKCECGTVKPVNIINLINGQSNDCGCGRKKTLRKICTKNLVGQRFGKLTAVELLEESNKFKRRLYKCKCDCGNEVILPSQSLISHHTMSCGCLISYYNMYIGQLLDELNVEYIPEYRVCIGESFYRFDFYLPKYNLFIEYDGQQHFYPIKYYGDDEEKNLESFKKAKERDEIKNNYCKENKIDLLRIPYWESKNIKTIITNHLQRLSGEGFVKAI